MLSPSVYTRTPEPRGSEAALRCARRPPLQAATAGPAEDRLRQRAAAAEQLGGLGHLHHAVTVRRRATFGRARGGCANCCANCCAQSWTSSVPVTISARQSSSSASDITLPDITRPEARSRGASQPRSRPGRGREKRLRRSETLAAAEGVVPAPRGAHRSLAETVRSSAIPLTAASPSRCSALSARSLQVTTVTCRPHAALQCRPLE